MSTGLDHEILPIPPPEEVAVPRTAVLKALAEVLSSKPFRTSKQCQMFLRYVVLNSLDGKEEALKERIIGCEVLERSFDYSTSDDPVVRIRAADVRKRLAIFYQDEGRNEPIRIAIPSGSYRAFFHPSGRLADSPAPLRHEAAGRFSEDAAAEHTSAVAFPLPLAEPRDMSLPLEQAAGDRFRGKRLRPMLALGVSLALLSVAFVFWLHKRSAYEPFDQFWAPAVGGSRPPIIYVGRNTVYRLKPDFLARYQAAHPGFVPDPDGVESVPAIDLKQPFTFSDLAADDHNFVGFGDVAAAVAISSLFKEKNVRFDLRFGRDMVFGDFRAAPVVLIGAFNNSWTIELNAKLPYRFEERDGERRIEGSGRSWQTKRTADGAPVEDYSLITRQISGQGGQPVIAVAGLDLTGTRAAAEFVSTPALLEAALGKLPPGWQNKTLQLVLHSTVTDDSPSGTELVAFSVQ